MKKIGRHNLPLSVEENVETETEDDTETAKAAAEKAKEEITEETETADIEGSWVGISDNPQNLYME